MRAKLLSPPAKALMVLALVALPLASCKESTPSTKRPTVPVSTPKQDAQAKPITPAGPLVGNVITLNIAKELNGKPAANSVMTLTLSRAANDYLAVNWRYESSNLENGLLPNDTLWLMLSGDGASTRLFNVALNPRTHGDTWQGGVFLHQGKDGKQLTDADFLGLDAPTATGLSLSGIFVAKLPDGAATSGRIGTAIMGFDNTGNPSPLVVDPPESQQNMVPASFRPFSYALLPSAPDTLDVPKLIESYQGRSKAGAALETALADVDKRIKAASELPDLSTRHEQSQVLRAEKLALFQKAFADDPSMLPAAIGILSHRPADSLTADDILAPVRLGGVFLPDSLAYARRLLLRGRFDLWTTVIEQLFVESTKINSAAVERMAESVCLDGIRDAMTIGIQFGRADLVSRIRAAITTAMPKPTDEVARCLALLDFTVSLASPDSKDPEALSNLANAINRLQVSTEFPAIISRLGSMHLSDFPHDRSLFQWRSIVAAAGEGPAGVTVIQSLGLLVRARMQRSGEPHRARELAMLVGENPPAPILEAEPTLRQTWPVTLATASILSSTDIAKSIAEWDGKLTPIDGTAPENDHRVMLAEDLAATASSIAEEQGAPWLRKTAQPISDYLRLRARPETLPQLLLAHAELLLSYGMANEASTLCTGLISDFEAIASRVPQDQQPRIREAMRRIPLAATLFAVADPTESDLATYDTMPDNERERLIHFFVMEEGHGGMPGLARRMLEYGMDEVADRGLARLAKLLESRKDNLRLMRLRAAQVDMLLLFGTPVAVQAALSNLDVTLEAVGKANADKYPQFIQREVYTARLHAKSGDIPAAVASLDAWIAANQSHSAKALMERERDRFKQVLSSITLEQAVAAKDPENLPRATFKTTEGTIEFVLYENSAPNTVAHFIATAESGYWNGKLVHRFVPGFVAQIGGKDGTATHSLEHRIRLEPMRRHLRGTLSMAREGESSAGPEHHDTAASDFFIVLHDYSAPHLDGAYAAFGRATSGLDVIDRLRKYSRILSVTISGKTKPTYTYQSLPPVFQRAR